MARIAGLTMLAAALLCGCGMLWGQDAGAQNGTTTPPDNTRTNQRDRNASEATADQQKENTPDRQLARQVRRALVQDKSLSMYAHNLKIIAQQGTVTLKGPVKTEEEKQEIEKKAAEVAGGPDKIQSEIQVTGDAGNKPSPDYK